MPQSLLSCQFEVDKLGACTALAGLPVYADLFAAAGLLEGARRYVGLRKRGWDDGMALLSMVLLNIDGGDHVADIGRLNADSTLSYCLRRAEEFGKSRREIRKIRKRRRRRGGHAPRQAPSESAILRYLYLFHDPDAIKTAKQEAKDAGRVAFVPEEHAGLVGLWRLNAQLLAWHHEQQPVTLATVDLDATCLRSGHESAMWCYKGYPGYQPMNVYWHEMAAVVYSQFRDGNVPANYGQLEVFKRSLEFLPAGVEQVRLRCDTAGYVWDLMKFCADGQSKRFGRIDFAVGANVTPELVKAVTEHPIDGWKRLMRRTEDGEFKTKHEYAEVVYVPNEAGRTKEGPHYRFIVTRERTSKDKNGAVQLALPGVGTADGTTLDVDGKRRGLFKLYAVCTTMEGRAEDIIWWHRARCGDSEQVHTTMKRDLAGGVMPCDRFGANAAWWAVMILAYNLNNAMRRLVLGGHWARREMKAIRLHLVHVAGRAVRHAGRTVMRVGVAAHELLAAVRSRILALT